MPYSVPMGHENEDTSKIATISLHVLLYQDADGWFAQALEVDYAASGESLEEVKKNFEYGLLETLREHSKMFNSFEHFVQPAPLSVWQDYFNVQRNPTRYKCTFEGCVKLPEQPFFDNVVYVKRDYGYAVAV